jgi:hypothetical protein
MGSARVRRNRAGTGTVVADRWKDVLATRWVRRLAMDGNTFWKMVGVVVVAYFAIKLVLWALAFLTGALKIGITIAVVVGIVWLLVQIFGKKKAYY